MKLPFSGSKIRIALVCINLKIPKPWPAIVQLSKQVSTTGPDSVLFRSILTAVEVTPIYKQKNQYHRVLTFVYA